MMWSDIFEDWPKAEINNGTRTYEFLPSFETFENATHQYQVPVSLYNITYITWEDNRSCDNFIWKSDFGIGNSAVVISYVTNRKKGEKLSMKDAVEFPRMASRDVSY